MCISVLDLTLLLSHTVAMLPHRNQRITVMQTQTLSRVGLWRKMLIGSTTNMERILSYLGSSLRMELIQFLTGSVIEGSPDSNAPDVQ